MGTKKRTIKSLEDELAWYMLNTDLASGWYEIEKEELKEHRAAIGLFGIKLAEQINKTRNEGKEGDDPNFLNGLSFCLGLFEECISNVKSDKETNELAHPDPDRFLLNNISNAVKYYNTQVEVPLLSFRFSCGVRELSHNRKMYIGHEITIPVADKVISKKR